MEIQLDINNVLALYKQKISDLEHELILSKAKCLEFEKLLKEKESFNNK